MAFSYVKYTGDGTTRVFSVPFAYLDRRHVSVKVNGTKAGFSWLSNSQVQTSGTPASGVTVEVRRNTPNTTALVDFTDGATLTERDLDTLALQALFMNQEAVDLSEELVEALEDETDADLSALRTTVKTIQTITTEAKAVATAADAVADEAMVLAQAASQTVTSLGSQINLDANRAVMAKDTAVTKAAEAVVSAGAAASSASAAGTSATNAASSATAAAASAQIATLAANFDPNQFYTKTQADTLLNTKVFQPEQVNGFESALSGKANTAHSHSIADVSGLQTALDGKLGTGSTAQAANRLTTPRTFMLTGDASGSANFDGTGNVTISVTVGDDSHTHSISTIAGLQGTLNDKSPGPTTLSSTTQNEFSPGNTGRHTHFIDPNLARIQLAATMYPGDIGCICFLRRTGTNTSIKQGETYSGSVLYYAGFRVSGDNLVMQFGDTPAATGTWRALSGSAGVPGEFSCAIFIRIA